jgi:catechol 2,3-dioxygenase-like lactoylglutathione lyase family enzyme
VPAPRQEGPFAAVDLGEATSLYFAGWDDVIAPQHYAFAVGPDEFDGIVDRLVAAGVEYRSTTSEPATVRRDGTGSGVYFRSPEGHLLEVLTHSHQAVEPGERNRR